MRSEPKRPRRWWASPRLQIAACGVAWAVFFGLLARARGPDASWDLRNYHIYGPFALFNGRDGFDIAPAQMQTWFPPTVDIPAYALRLLLNDHPGALGALLALPQAIGALLATLIARRFIAAPDPWRWPLAILVAAVGATGAASLSTLATAQSEILSGCLILGGVLILLRDGPRPLLAGLLFGAAAGLRLPCAPYCAAAIAAVLATWDGPARARFTAAGLLCLGIAAGALAVGGWWWARLWLHFGNPIFPLYNALFRSPFFPAENLLDERFKPASVLHAVLYPAFWGLWRNHLVTEPDMRDPRFLLALVAVVAESIRQLSRPRAARHRPTLRLLVFAAVAFAAWEALFSVFRYLAPLEMLTGLLMYLPLRWLAGRNAVALATVAVIALPSLTIYPRWGTASPRDKAVAVAMPEVAPNSLVLVLDQAPVGYLAPYLPPSARLLGVNNSLLRPGIGGLLQQREAALIAAHAGPFYGIEEQAAWPGMADHALASYNLRRAPGCTPIVSNLDPAKTLLCRLVRAD